VDRYLAEWVRRQSTQILARAAAGLLGVQLDKKGVYTLGDRHNPVAPVTVRQIGRLVVLVGGLVSGLCMLAILGVNFLC
jgi:cobalamin biosynthesis protein CobD/CbiB